MRVGLVRGAGGLVIAILVGTAAGLAVAETETPLEAPAKPVALRHGLFRHTSYPAAWTAAQESGRPILVFVTSENCPHCSRMLGETLQSSAVRSCVRGSFETVLVDRSEQPELAAKLHVRWFPSTLVVGCDNKVSDVSEGYVDQPAFARRLQTTRSAQVEKTQTR